MIDFSCFWGYDTLFVNAYQRIFATAETNPFGMFDGVYAMLFVNTAQKVGGVVLGCDLLLVDDVNTSLVEGYRVC